MYAARSKIRLFGKVFIAIVMVATIYGCGVGDAATTGTFRITNNSGITVTEAFLAPSSSSTWGADQLTTDLPSGSSRDIGGVSCEFTYDFYATNAPGVSDWGPQFGISIPCDGIFTMELL
jgi:hypothetical protein